MLDRSKELGFLGPGPVDDHIVNALGFVELIRDRSTVLDLGSGGGVPGLVLAVALPDCRMVLLDAMEKRCRFLRTAVEDLDLAERVTVWCGRAEEAARAPELRMSQAVVVSRSFAPPAVTAECAAGFLSGPGSILVVSEPPDASPTPTRWPRGPLEELGLALGARKAGTRGTLQVLEVVAPCPDRYPRRTGVPSKRPLW